MGSPTSCKPDIHEHENGRLRSCSARETLTAQMGLAWSHFTLRALHGLQASRAGAEGPATVKAEVSNPSPLSSLSWRSLFVCGACSRDRADLVEEDMASRQMDSATIRRTGDVSSCKTQRERVTSDKPRTLSVVPARGCRLGIRRLTASPGCCCVAAECTGQSTLARNNACPTL